MALALPARDWTDAEIVTVTYFNQMRDNLREFWHDVAYVEFTADVTATTGGADVVTSGALIYLAVPTLFEFSAMSTAATARLLLYDGATNLGVMEQTATRSLTPSRVVKKLTPTAGSHTYKVVAKGSGLVMAGLGGNDVKMPGYLRVLQRGPL